MDLLDSTSLRSRLIGAITLSLLASFAAAAILSTWHDARMVRDEVSAALDTGKKDAAVAVADNQNRREPTQALAGFIATFNASRHLAVFLVNADGRVLARSRPAPARTPPPPWFAALVAPRLDSVVVPLTSAQPGPTLRLLPEPASEIGERWSEARDKAALLGLLSVLAAALCSITLSHSLRPLRSLAAGLDRLGAGERSLSLAASGPPEIARLASAFNRLAALLEATEQHNARLQSQLLRVAEEERMDLARDLHDDVGPLLFAINTRAATIARMADAGTTQDIPPQLHAIRQSVALLQDGVRAMLHKLRGDEDSAPDLAVALRGLVAFWSELRPTLHFDLVIEADPGGLPQAAQTALLRVAQEGVSNAVRHGKPSHIGIDLRCDRHDVLLTITDDGTDDGCSGVTADGYGLRGLRERIFSLGGVLAIDTVSGWALSARLPLI